jgi:polyisoprenoid-binding protein YceI
MKMNPKKIFSISLAIILLASFLAFKIVGSSWTVNSKAVKISWTQPNGKHSGTIGDLVSTIDFDPMSPDLAKITGSVEVKTIDAGNPQLNEHLQTPDFFDAANHPLISFTADKVTKTDSGFVAIGKLAMRDSVKTISIPFTFSKSDDKTATLKGTMDIFSGDYGIGKKSDAGKDRVVISIEVPLTK